MKQQCDRPTTAIMEIKEKRKIANKSLTQGKCSNQSDDFDQERVRN